MKEFLIIFSVVAFFFINSHSADSMCVYNSSSVKDLQVDFDCGIFCDNIWVLQPCAPNKPIPGCYACRYGKGGLIAAGPGFGSVWCQTMVAPHGWVIISGTDVYNLICTPHK